MNEVFLGTLFSSEVHRQYALEIGSENSEAQNAVFTALNQRETVRIPKQQHAPDPRQISSPKYTAPCSDRASPRNRSRPPIPYPDLCSARFASCTVWWYGQLKPWLLYFVVVLAMYCAVSGLWFSPRRS